jgi:hypothetical protein
MWKILPTLLIALSTTGTAHAQRPEFFKDHPTDDQVRADGFFAKWPALAKVYNQRDLDPLLFPGGDACDVGQAAVMGTFSESSMSPDGKQLAVITAVHLQAKVAKKLGMDDSVSAVTVVAILFDGPAKKIAAFELPDGGGCDRPDVGMTWSADGKAIQVASKSGRPYAAILDVGTHSVRTEQRLADPVFSPALGHVAGITESDGALQIDDTVVWSPNEKGAVVTNLVWSSDVRLSFCGGKPKDAAKKYQADVVAGAKPKLTPLGPCSSSPPAPVAPPAH